MLHFRIKFIFILNPPQFTAYRPPPQLSPQFTTPTSLLPPPPPRLLPLPLFTLPPPPVHQSSIYPPPVYPNLFTQTPQLLPPPPQLDWTLPPRPLLLTLPVDLYLKKGCCSSSDWKRALCPVLWLKSQKPWTLPFAAPLLRAKLSATLSASFRSIASTRSKDNSLSPTTSSEITRVLYFSSGKLPRSVMASSWSSIFSPISFNSSWSFCSLLTCAIILSPFFNFNV